MSFGEDIRRSLEDGVFESFAAIGRALDDYLRRISAGRTSPDGARALGRRLTGLAHEVYHLDVAMLRRVHEGRLGPTAQPAAAAAPATNERPTLEFGVHGAAVRRLQKALRAAGHADLVPDGQFGRATDDAVRSYQRSAGLDADGVVGPRTWEALGRQDEA